MLVSFCSSKFFASFFWSLWVTGLISLAFLWRFFGPLPSLTLYVAPGDTPSPSHHPPLTWTSPCSPPRAAAPSHP